MKYEEAIGPARDRAAGFVAALEPGARVVVFCHFDADGLASGALVARGLERLGHGGVRVVPSGRGESAFSEEARGRLRGMAPDALIVTDLGVDRVGVLHGVATLYIDHHRPDGEPEDAVVVSAYGWDPTPSSAWLAYDLLSPLTELGDLAWLAAIGVVGDLGDRAPWPELAEVKRRHGAKWLREAVSLINAARRASAFDVATPLSLLLEAEGPRGVVEGSPGAERLRGYRAEVRGEVERVARIAPVFSDDRRFALIRFRSACQIHPLLAERWRRRLREQVVIAANAGYLPGVVAFAARTERTDVSLPALFRSFDPEGRWGGRFGRGHDRASGGHLPREAFNRMLAMLGFPPSAGFG